MTEGDVAEAEGVPFSDMTTMRVGGFADRLIVARTPDELARHALELWASAEPWLLLGGGSNTVMRDEGFDGTVLLVRNEGVDLVLDEPSEQPSEQSSEQSNELVRDEALAPTNDSSADQINEPIASSAPTETPRRVRLRVQAGQDWDQLVGFCVEQGWAGIEALSGIPGSAGAAPVQNIGAYGTELSDVLHSIEFLEADSGEVVRLYAADLELAYRTSTIKQGLEGVVISVDLVLQTSHDGLSTAVRYEQLADELGVQLGDRVPLRELREAVLRLRASKGMVLDEADYDTWSSGSFFTNPIVTERFARTLPREAPRFVIDDDEQHSVVVSFEELERGLIPALPTASAPRMVKLSAAWLIEQSGIGKGFRFPGSGAAISSKHTLAITNRGSASAADVAELARFIMQRVQQEFGLVLVPEPNLYGLEL